jgi:membrane dipeptidase
VVQLVHSVANDLGDIQTGDVQHSGMSPLGAQVIRELNRLGVVVDVAHGTEAMTRQAAKVTTRPLLLSHTALAGSKAMSETVLAPRRVTPDHARAVADTGGVVALWHFFPTLERYVDGIRELVDVVGVEHVGIGTDQQKAPGAVQKWTPALAGGDDAEEGLHGGRDGQDPWGQRRPRLRQDDWRGVTSTR